MCLLQQNALETLCLIAGTTRESENEYFDLAIKGKIIEFAALHIVTEGMEKFDDIKSDVYDYCTSFRKRSLLDKGQKEKVESVLCFLEVLDNVGYSISKYIREDKYNVCNGL